MHGDQAIIINFFQIAIPLVILGTAVRLVRERKPIGKVVILISGAILLISVYPIIIASMHRYQLGSLQEQGVQQMIVGRNRITDAHTLQQLTVALNDLEPYLPNHDSEPTMPIIIQLKTGETLLYRIRLIRTQPEPAVIIQFVRAGASSYANEGYGYSTTFADAIIRLGILP